MQNKIIILLCFISILSLDLQARESDNTEKYGRTLNLGIGLGGHYGYYGYANRSLPIFNFNYEIDIVNSFTLAPFISFYTYSRNRKWGDNQSSKQSYRYRQTAIPIGVKGTYYFDRLLNAGARWDFYLASSAGFTIVSSRWESGYEGDKKHFGNPNPLFLDIHIGAEYHITDKLGVFLDLSSGASTIGLAIHGLPSHR